MSADRELQSCVSLPHVPTLHLPGAHVQFILLRLPILENLVALFPVRNHLNTIDENHAISGSMALKHKHSMTTRTSDLDHNIRAFTYSAAIDRL